MNQAIEANIVRPELPEEADRVEQLLVNILFLLINRTQSRHKDTQNTEHRTQNRHTEHRQGGVASGEYFVLVDQQNTEHRQGENQISVHNQNFALYP